MANVSENQSAAILGIPYAAWYEDGNDANWIREASCREVIAVAQRMGVDLGEDDLIRQREMAKCVPAWGKPSTLQDIEAGRPTEVNVFGNAVPSGTGIWCAHAYQRPVLPHDPRAGTEKRGCMG